jgi:hypothetical protein
MKNTTAAISLFEVQKLKINSIKSYSKTSSLPFGKGSGGE